MFLIILLICLLLHQNIQNQKKSGVVGNQVEFIPNVNIKTGFRFGYKYFLSSL